MLRMTHEVTIRGTGDSGPFGRAELYKRAQNSLTSIVQQMPTHGVFWMGLGRWTGDNLCSSPSFRVVEVTPSLTISHYALEAVTFCSVTFRFLARLREALLLESVVWAST
jgi:hypothetical protein